VKINEVLLNVQGGLMPQSNKPKSVTLTNRRTEMEVCCPNCRSIKRLVHRRVGKHHRIYGARKLTAEGKAS
jgi:hypothetical protein